VITPVDQRFMEEAELYRLRFSCEACAYFDAESGRCGNGYPNADHRWRSLKLTPHVVFCKEFELGQ